MGTAGSGQTVVVLGGGIGGVVAANRLRRKLDRRHRVVLVNREAEFSFAASYLWVMTGDRTSRQVTRPLQRLGRRGIEVVIGDGEAIDPATRTVTVDGRELAADHLVVSLGAQQVPQTIPGMAEHGHTFATLPGARRLGIELDAIEGAGSWWSPGPRSIAARRRRTRRRSSSTPSCAGAVCVTASRWPCTPRSRCRWGWPV